MFFNKAKTEPLPEWVRKYYQVGSRPQVFYAIYGDFVENPFQVSRSKYACEGVPRRIDIQIYKDDKLSNLMWPFKDDPLKTQLAKNSPLLFSMAKNSKSCVVIKGEIEQDESLNYLRDLTGFITALMDNGGAAVLDLYTFSLWGGDDWRKKFFNPESPVFGNHVTILDSQEDNGTSWLRTRGMIKFGRPDLSVHFVNNECKNGIVEMIKRFIGLQTEGGVVSEGQAIQMQGVPNGLRCYHRGDMQDPDFNNVHIEIE